MAITQSIKVPAHHNIYDNSVERELRIDFSIPEKGTNADTGLVLLVPGFGATIDSKVYSKMRDVFSDTYNLVTIQCSYFGDEFMQSTDEFTLKNNGRELNSLLNADELQRFKNNPSELLEILSTKVTVFTVSAKIEESLTNFNDMGWMQAIDIITSIEAVQIILKENGIAFNKKKVIGYGHSHGAYLLHLGNRLDPHLFSHIIDNSAWIEPVYLNNNRYISQRYGSMTLQIEFDYIGKRVIKDKKALNLNSLYQGFDNQSKLMVFQGTNDNLINHDEKSVIVNQIKHAEIELIDETSVDGHIFKSNNHGLDADFLNLFNYAYEKMGEHINPVERKSIYNLKLSNTEIQVDYSFGLPVFTIDMLV